jgi:uncharacterized protein (DUF2236 family)
MRDPFGRVNRTLKLGQELVFGSTPLARQAAKKINHLHRHVHGELPVEAGRFPQGTPYDARDPELLLWVHATLIDSLLLSYKLFVGPLTHTEEEQYYQESKGVAHLLGLLPSQMPESIDDLQQYVLTMIQSDQLASTEQARELARQTLFPPAHKALKPLMHLNFAITNALLPPSVREIYGFTWSQRQQQAFELSARSLRFVVPHTPLFLRELPITRRLKRSGAPRQTA